MEQETGKLTRRQKKIIAGLGVAIFVLFSAAIVWFVGRPILRFVSEPEQFRLWVDQHGIRGRLTYVGIVFLQVLVAVIPGEPLEIGGGYAFGALEGTILCLLGAFLGSVAVFAIVRKLGMRVVEAFFPPEKIESLRFLLHSEKKELLFMVIFTIPGTPKDLLCYFAGLTKIKWPVWLLISSLGRLPSIITSTVGGSALGGQNYWFAIIVFAVTLVLSVGGLVAYQKICQKNARKKGAADAYLPDFSVRRFHGLLIRGDLHGAVDYLKQYPERTPQSVRYERVFGQGVFPKKPKNPVLRGICNLFRAYDREVFWQQIPKTEAEKHLLERAGQLTGKDFLQSADTPDGLPAALERMEKALAALAGGEGYHYRGGETQGYLGPYIWGRQEEKTYRVTLPQGEETYTVRMMDDFAYRSWLADLSFGHIGTGGWVEEDGTMACVRSAYRKVLHTARFRVDFLKHEAQHVRDRREFPGLAAAELEYRAKLIQLLYARTPMALLNFVSEADTSDPDNSHAVAAARLLTDLAEKLRVSPTQDAAAWRKCFRHIRKAAAECLETDTARLRQAGIAGDACPATP